MILPDAPWIRDPERYADDYYGGCYINSEEDVSESEEDAGDLPESR